MEPTTPREQLARDIFLADNSNAPEEAMRIEWDRTAGMELTSYAHNIAYGLHAAGYRKPRVLGTVEELIAVEDPDAILTDYDGRPYQWGEDVGGGEGWRAPHAQTAITSQHLWRLRPITVLREPAQ